MIKFTLPRLTLNQVKWAQGHDWFIGLNRFGYLVVREDDGEATWIGTFKDLKDWAGY